MQWSDSPLHDALDEQMYYEVPEGRREDDRNTLSFVLALVLGHSNPRTTSWPPSMQGLRPGFRTGEILRM